MVGDQQGRQNLSIGTGCDYKAIIEHELLHALGFYHEQSRTDRDDYVTIHWDEILQGMYGPAQTRGLLLSFGLSETICGRPRLTLWAQEFQPFQWKEGLCRSS